MAQHLIHRRHRPMLALPAVYPCESASPATLLAGVAVLAGHVASVKVSRETFPVLRCCFREVVRIAGVVLAVAEGVLHCGGELRSPSTIVGLSELHVAMQKIRLLVIDCGRRGCRLWLLMKSECIAAELRVLLSSVATAADVLHPHVAALSEEAAEMVSLLSAQARRSSCSAPAASDKCAAWTVLDCLDAFRNRTTPDAATLLAVMDTLRITSWSCCADEIAFLEDELVERLSDEDEAAGDEVPFLGSLIALLVYCRVVLFQSINSKKGETTMAVDSPAREVVRWLKPESLQCPISLEMMTDPVTVSTGQTYDRTSIKKWFKAGCQTCPITGGKLGSTDLIPNVAVHRLVEKFCVGSGIELPEQKSGKRYSVDKTASPFSPAAAGAMQLAVEFLIKKLSIGTPEEKKKASFEIRKMSKYNVFNRVCLVSAGVVPWLLYLLLSPDPSTQDNAVAALLNLSKFDGGRKALFDAGGLGLIVDVVKLGAKVETRQNAAAVLFYVSAVEDYCKEIGDISEAIPTLVELLRDGGYRGKKNAVVSLYALMQHASNHQKLVAAGGVAVLAGLLFSEREDLAIDTVALLEKIASGSAASVAILLRTPAIPRVVELLSSTPSRSGKENCVSLLLSLCNYGGEHAISALGGMQGLMSSLYSIIADGATSASKKARSLLNMIHRHCEHEGRRPTPPPPRAAVSADGDRVVHAQ